MGLKPRKPLQRPGVFDPRDATRIKHTRIGVWDLYEEKHSDIPIPGASRLETTSQMLQGVPYVWRMLKDICSTRRCLVLMMLYLATEVATSLIPAVSLWSVSHTLARVNLFTLTCQVFRTASPPGMLHLMYIRSLFNIAQVETAVEKRTVDRDVLLHVAAGRVACTIVERLLKYAKHHITHPLNLAIKQFYSTHIFHAMARLDLPTFEDPAVQRQLEGAWPTSWRSSVAWDTIQMISNVLMTVIQVLSQVSVLISVLRNQQDGTLLALLSFSQSLFQWFSRRRFQFTSLGALSMSYLNTLPFSYLACDQCGLQQPKTKITSKCRGTNISWTILYTAKKLSQVLLTST